MARGTGPCSLPSADRESFWLALDAPLLRVFGTSPVSLGSGFGCPCLPEALAHDTRSHWGLLLHYDDQVRVTGYSLPCCPNPFSCILGTNSSPAQSLAAILRLPIRFSLARFISYTVSLSVSGRLGAFCQAPATAANGALFRLSPSHGVRIGEASHPGPFKQTQLAAYFPGRPSRAMPPSPASPVPQCHAPQSSFTIAVVNPTSVLHKSRALVSLGADVVALSETSAVQRTQTIVSAEVRKSDFKVYWGHPVPSHTRPGSDKEILRGHACHGSHPFLWLPPSSPGTFGSDVPGGRGLTGQLHLAGFEARPWPRQRPHLAIQGSVWPP